MERDHNRLADQHYNMVVFRAEDLYDVEKYVLGKGLLRVRVRCGVGCLPLYRGRAFRLLPGVRRLATFGEARVSGLLSP
jgi:hypothetical protein